MRVTVQYIPLNKLKPDLSVKMTQNIQKLRSLMADCMHLIAVKKNKKNGQYIIVSGHDRFEYLRKHTNKKYVPCIVDENKVTSGLKTLIHRFPEIAPEQMVPTSWAIIRAYLKQDPRFRQLSYHQQLKVLLLAIRYKKTVIRSMKTLVEELVSK